MNKKKNSNDTKDVKKGAQKKNAKGIKRNKIRQNWKEKKTENLCLPQN